MNSEDELTELSFLNETKSDDEVLASETTGDVKDFKGCKQDFGKNFCGTFDLNEEFLMQIERELILYFSADAYTSQN